jgi:hypothetical protein
VAVVAVGGEREEKGPGARVRVRGGGEAPFI